MDLGIFLHRRENTNAKNHRCRVGRTGNQTPDTEEILEGLRGEMNVAELCRKEGLNPNVYYKWSKEFLEAGKKRLLGDTERAATSGEVAPGDRRDCRVSRVPLLASRQPSSSPAVPGRMATSNRSTESSGMKC